MHENGPNMKSMKKEDDSTVGYNPMDLMQEDGSSMQKTDNQQNKGPNFKNKARRKYDRKLVQKHMDQIVMCINSFV